MGALHLGTDGGGSIRIPAAFTGCFGLKPTRARVPAFPAVAARHASRTIGPLTRTVADAALAMSVIAAPDTRDVYGWISPAPDFSSGLDDGVRGLRIAYSPQLGFAPPRPSGDRERRGQRPPRPSRASAPGSRRPIRTSATTPSAPGTHSGGRPCSTSCRRSATARASWPIRPCSAAADKSAAVPVFDTIRAQLHRAHLHNVMAKFHETYDLLLTPSPAAAGVRGRRPGAALGRLGHGVVRLGALQLSLQPDDAAGGLGSMRADESGLADRTADRRRRRRGCSGPAREPRFRDRPPFPTLDAPRTGT